MKRLLLVLLGALLLVAVLFVAFGGRIYVDMDVVAPNFSFTEGSLPGVDVTPGDLPDIKVDPAAPRN